MGSREPDRSDLAAVRPGSLRRALLGWGGSAGRTAARDTVLGAERAMNTHTECWLAETAEGREMIARFRASFGTILRDVQRAVDGRDHDTLRRLAHRLRGTAPNYGFPEVGRAAAAVEDALLHGDDIGVPLATLRASLADGI